MRDFWGVTFCAFFVACYVVFRISAVGSTPLPIPQPTSENAGSMLVVLLLLLAVLVLVWVCFNVWIAVVVGRVVFGGWRDLSPERLLLASVIALLWVSDLDALTRYSESSATLPPVLLGAFFVWGVIANTVVVYWLTGAIQRLSRG